MSNKVDILIAGSGSAGICAALWLSRCGVSCKIVESSPGPLLIGKADGVQCRTVEVFDSFGIAEELLRESYHVLEVTFWNSSENEKEGIVKERAAADTAPGLSHQPHVILNQARVNGLMLEAAKRDNGLEVEYGVKVLGVEVDGEMARDDPDAYAVAVRTEREGKEEVVYAKYVLGSDGAHSSVRRSLGFKMLGDSTDSIWGVMDIYPRTNFPDLRKKVAIRTPHGSLMIIPREGGSLVRFYIELPPGTLASNVTLSDLQATAKKIFYPYTMDFADTFWWSAYSIGQRLADFMSKDDRVFLMGDSCHTHSPKAGQGMNTSLQDGYNIGWKLAHVLKKQAPPSLLKTYVLERQKVAHDLIAFDREWAKAFASTGHKGEDEEKQKKKFSEIFVEAGRFTAGLTARYQDSEITWQERSKQELATNLIVGMRVPSTQVVRWCDARAMQFVKAMPSDGRWRVVVFAGDVLDERSASRLQKLSTYLSSPSSPTHIQTHTTSSSSTDSLIENLLLFSTPRALISQDAIPQTFFPITGLWKMRDPHKIFVDDESYNSGHGKAYEFYGVDRQKGAMVVVRPDQYVSAVLEVGDCEGLGAFFGGWMMGGREQDGRIEG